MEGFTIKEVAAILRRGLWLILTVALIVTSAVGVYYYGFAKDRYIAEMKLFVLINYGDTMGAVRYDVDTSTSFAGDYQQLIKTHEVLSVAADKLGVKNLDAVHIDVSSQENTRVICLSVTGEDPAFCMNAANTIGEVFIEYMESIMQTKGVRVASKALMPGAPSGPNRLMYVAAALVVSILLASGALIVTTNMNATLRTSEEVENFLNTPVLACITDYRKEIGKFMAQKGTRKPLYYSVSQETRESIKMLSMNLQFVSGGNPVKTLAITSTAPNEGKSTIACMLASALAEAGKRVLLCDMDFKNPSLRKYLGTQNRLDIVDMLNGTAKMEKIITACNIKGLFMVDSCHKRVLLSNVVQSPQYKEFIDVVSHHFDYVIFDTPPLGLFIDSAMLASTVDRTLLVIASGRVDRALGKKIVDQLQKANASTIGVALNFVDKRKNHYGRYYRHYQKSRYDRSLDGNDPDVPERLRA